jgi:hypothetical protein
MVMSAHTFVPRFSIRQLLLATAFVAIGCYALRWASPWWSILLFYATLAFLAVGSMVALHFPGERRAFWTAFIVCALAHWLLVHRPGLSNGLPPLYPAVFVTHWFSAYSYSLLKSHLTVEPIQIDPLEIGQIRGRSGGEYLDAGITGAPGTGASASVPSLLAGEDGRFYGLGPGPFYIHEEDFVQVALGLWTLLLAYLAGHVSLAVYRTRAAAKVASG